MAISAERDAEATLERAVDLARVTTRSRYGVGVASGATVVQGLTRAQLASLPGAVPVAGLVGAVLEAKDPIRIDRLRDDERAGAVPFDVLPVEAFLGVPVLGDGEVLGGVLLARPPGQEPFTDQDELLVQAIARQAAVALEAAGVLAEKEREIADRHRAEMLVRLLQVVAAAANQAATLEEAMQACIDEVCEQTGWAVGHAWVANADGRLVSSDVWRLADPARYELLRQVSAPLEYEKGTGLLGLVFASGQPVWLSPITADPRFPRSTETVACGLRTVYMFPVAVGDESAAVLEFFSSEEEGLDRQLLDTMGHVVVQLGRVVERIRAEREQERHAAALEEANKELRVADQLKSDFVSMASHELRTPLTSIVGFASTLLSYWEDTSDTDKREYVGVIDRQAQRLSRLVNDLLAMSRIESGALNTHRVRVDLGAALAQAVADMGASGSGVTVRAAEGVAALADPDHVQQILVNYLSNAVKYGQPPIEVVADADGPAAVVVRVRDHGPGVAPAFVDHLFDKFSQASTGSTRQASGTGLGLSIVRGLASANGGTAWYEPADPGSVFCLRLERAR